MREPTICCYLSENADGNIVAVFGGSRETQLQAATSWTLRLLSGLSQLAWDEQLLQQRMFGSGMHEPAASEPGSDLHQPSPIERHQAADSHMLYPASQGARATTSGSLPEGAHNMHEQRQRSVDVTMSRLSQGSSEQPYGERGSTDGGGGAGSRGNAEACAAAGQSNAESSGDASARGHAPSHSESLGQVGSCNGDAIDHGSANASYTQQECTRALRPPARQRLAHADIPCAMVEAPSPRGASHGASLSLPGAGLEASEVSGVCDECDGAAPPAGCMAGAQKSGVRSRPDLLLPELANDARSKLGASQAEPATAAPDSVRIGSSEAARDGVAAARNTKKPQLPLDAVWACGLQLKAAVVVGPSTLKIMPDGHLQVGWLTSEKKLVCHLGSPRPFLLQANKAHRNCL